MLKTFIVPTFNRLRVQLTPSGNPIQFDPISPPRPPLRNLPAPAPVATPGCNNLQPVQPRLQPIPTTTYS